MTYVLLIPDLAKVRYDYRGQSSAALDEAEKYGHRRQAEAEAKRIAEGGDPNEVPEYRLKTPEEEHVEYMKKHGSDLQDYQMVGGRHVQHVDKKCHANLFWLWLIDLV